jgi:RNA polymerase sigma factor (sigma-70 family)
MDSEDGESLGLHGILVASIEAPDDTLQAIEMNARLEQAMEVLTEKERGIVARRYGLGAFKATGPKTLEQVGNDYGLTRERIRQIEVKALLLMRRHLSYRELTTCARLSVPSSL